MLDDARSGAGCARQVCWLPMGSIILRQEALFAQGTRIPLEQLAASIQREGLIRPIMVESMGDGRYRILSGNRRYLACRMAGLTHIDAVVLHLSAQSQGARGLMTALLSGKLHYLEEADAMARLTKDYGVKKETLATALGRSSACVSQKLKLCGMDRELRAVLLEENLPEGVAHALMRLPDSRMRLAIARRVAEQKLCVRDAELLVKSAMSRLPVQPVPGGRTISVMRDYRLYVNAIRAIAAQMQDAGIHATATQRTMGEEVEVVVRIPTRKAGCGR